MAIGHGDLPIVGCLVSVQHAGHSSPGRFKKALKGRRSSLDWFAMGGRAAEKLGGDLTQGAAAADHIGGSDT
jgi:hypothetical protein